MRIVIYSHDFLPTRGGVQTIVFELACGLGEWSSDQSQTGPLEVTVVTQTPGQGSEDGSWPFRVVRQPSFGHLFRLLRTAHVIHLAGPAVLPMMIGLTLRKTVIVEHHGYQSICPNGILLLGAERRACPGHFMARRYWQCARCNSRDMGWLRSFRSLILQFPRRWLCRFVSSNIAITNHVAGRIELPHTRTILHGIRDPGPTAFPQERAEVQIGCIGRLVQEKGLPLLLEAGKRLKDDGFSFHLTFVGGGPLRELLEKESQNLGIARHVSFTGDLAGPDLERVVRPIQIVVMPSLWEETAGLAAIEQMMRGGVVIASDIGGLSEVVGDAGLKFVPGDSQALYARLREVLEAPSLAASLGSLARVGAVQTFSRDKMIQAHVSLYREVARHE
jgi:glycogen synthase